MVKQNYKAPKPPGFSGKIGVSRKDITPPAGIYSRNWGAANLDAALGIHRPLVMVCFSFQSLENGQPLILFSADLGFWRNLDDWKLLQAGILEALSLSPAQLLFCLSHTHAGPSICRDDAGKTGGEHIEPYLLRLQACAIEAAKEALANATLATLTWKYGTCDLAANRDLPQYDTNRMVVGYNPGRQADDTVLVGRITDKEDKIIGTIVNYACHPTTLAWDNPYISPDYVGAMRELVEKEAKGHCLFLQGASGDLAPAEQYLGDTAIADKHGRQLGYAVLSTLESMLPPGKQLDFDRMVESGAGLALWSRSGFQPLTECSAEILEAPLPLKPLPDLEELKKQYNECNDRVLKERLWRKLNTRKNVGGGDAMKFSIWIWKLGDSFLIAHSAEAYSDFQSEIRKRFPGLAIAAINLANGGSGYLPVASLYERDAYAAWHSPFAQGSLELLTQTAIDSLAHTLLHPLQR
jgi:hypothetical protein